MREDETPHDIISNEKRKNILKKIKSILEKHIYHRGSSLREIEYVAEDIIQDVMQADENMVLIFWNAKVICTNIHL